MDAIPSFAAHEPSSEQLSRIAAQLLSEAAAGAAPAPSTSSTPAPPHAFILPAQPFSPSVQPFAPETAATLRTAAAAPEDFSGLKSFVARIRGSDAFAAQPPRYSAAAPAGVARFEIGRAHV